MSDDAPVILLVFANELTDSAYLRALSAERRAIEEALDVAASHGRCRLVVETDATHAALFDRLDEVGDRLVGVHFGGHADPEGLTLQGDAGRGVPARMAGIADRLGALPGLRWVFLNGCGTQAHVDALHRRSRVPVIATDRAIRDRVAADFAERFYHALGAGQSIGASFASARSEMLAHHRAPTDALRAGEQLRLLRPGGEIDRGWPWILITPTDAPEGVDWRLPERRRSRSMLGVALLAGLALGGLGLGGLLMDRADPPAASPTPPAAPDAASDARPARATPPPGFVEIPAGRFVMGSPPDEAWRDDDEGPQRTVVFDRPLWVQTHEVSQGQWSALMGTRPSWSACDDCPVGRVNWYEALAYANALSRAEGVPECYRLEHCSGEFGRGCPQGAPQCRREVWRCGRATLTDVDCLGYRLPTEAEWEYFTRAGTTSAHPAGSTPEALADIAWYHDNHGEMAAPPRGSKAPNAWGLYDVLGSHAEWCFDRYGPYATGPVDDPLGPGEGAMRAYRGGAIASHIRAVRSAARRGLDPGQRTVTSGFRLVRRPPNSAPRYDAPP